MKKAVGIQPEHEISSEGSQIHVRTNFMGQVRDFRFELGKEFSLEGLQGKINKVCTTLATRLIGRTLCRDRYDWEDH